MEPNNSQNRVAKRSSNACTRCRRQKIKCSGQQPCNSCTKKHLDCIFDDRENKILVTQGYLADLQEKVSRLERGGPRHRDSPESDGRDDEETPARDMASAQREIRHAHSPSNEGTHPSSPSRSQSGPNPRDLTNPLTTMPPKFMAAPSGKLFYLGTSSNWAFHGQILNLVHERVYRAPLSMGALLFDGYAHELPWDGFREMSGAITIPIPSVDHTIYLMNAVKFHCSQLLHLFDEDSFTAELVKYYSDNHENPSSLWYIQFLLIIAFGKNFVQQKAQAKRHAGADFFMKALQLLPDHTALAREPMMATEILCCIALYLQALDHRNAAYAYIGQAMRIALADGMHTDMPINFVGDACVQTCRKIWWTVYVLDRQMTSLMGLPQSIQDEYVYCKLPTFTGSIQRAAALDLQIKIARILAEINTTVYGSKGRLKRKFLTSIKSVLDGIGGLANELRQTFPLNAERRLGGISRMSAHLHLQYYQSIVLATRPLLLISLKKRLDSPQEIEPLMASKNVKGILQVCIESSQNIIKILESLQEQGLLETFLPWDLDSLFSATVALLVAWGIDKRLLEHRSPWLETAHNLLEVMVSNGNRTAEFRKGELQKLDQMLNEFVTDQMHSFNVSEIPLSGPSATNMQDPATTPFLGGAQDGANNHQFYGDYNTLQSYSDEGSGYGDDLTVEQIVAVADSVGIGDVEWLTFASMDNFPLHETNGMPI